jgi:hypothetical protein
MVHSRPTPEQVELARWVLQSSAAKELRDQATKIVGRALGMQNEPKRMTDEEVSAMRFAISFLRDYGKYPSARGYQADYRSATSADKLTRIKHADALATFIGEYSFGASADNENNW